MAPSHPEIYISDYPSTAFVNSYEEASNISLKSKTCLYLREDIPLRAAPTDIDQSKSISCHDWSSSFVYNHISKKYESPQNIDPFCLED